jgi:hypothetical protein
MNFFQFNSLDGYTIYLIFLLFHLAFVKKNFITWLHTVLFKGGHLISEDLPGSYMVIDLATTMLNL